MEVKLSVIEGPDKGRRFRFAQRDRFMVGRAADAHLSIPGDRAFSRHHFMVEVNPPNLYLEDLGSTNGTFVNDGDQPAREAVLRHGDRIRGGDTVLLVEVDQQVGPDTEPQDLHQQSTFLFHPVPPAEDDLLLDDDPAARDPELRIEVRCLRCGVQAPNEQPRLRREQMAYFCEPCQQALLNEPLLMPGYQVVRELGRGAMGAVYLARQQSLDRLCALKMVLPRASLSAEVRRMFLREATEQARLHHPHIVSVFDLKEVRPGIFCMAMEYVEGDNARALLRARPRGLPPEEAVGLMAQALEGLSYAHDHGVIHRDVKDANILIGPDQRVKLSDFGLAKNYQTSGASGFTRTGHLAGTVYYMAPEQITNFRDVRPPADLYSMGVTLYHLLCGAFPYDFADGTNPFLTILEEPVVPLQQRQPALPPRLCQAVERALNKDVAKRYQSGQQMRQALLDSL